MAEGRRGAAGSRWGKAAANGTLAAPGVAAQLCQRRLQ